MLVGYTDGVDDINDSARFIENGSDTTMEIDADGLAGGADFEAVAMIVGGAGLDANALESSGHLDAVI